MKSRRPTVAASLTLALLASAVFVVPASAGSFPVAADTALGRAQTASLVGSVDAGEQHTCGLRTNGTIACWGSDGFGQATPPAGQFAALSVHVSPHRSSK